MTADPKGAMFDAHTDAEFKACDTEARLLDPSLPSNTLIPKR